MNAVDGATIERRIRINRPDDENTRCKVSRAWDPRKDFSQPTRPPTTHSTSNAISPQQERTEPSGRWPCRGVISAVEPDEPAFKFQQRDNARIIDIVVFRAKITNSRNELEVSLPEPVTQMICQPDRERCDGKRW